MEEVFLSRKEKARKFEIFKGKDQQVYFHIRGNNGEILTHCEGYTRKESAKDTIESIRKWAASADIDERV